MNQFRIRLRRRDIRDEEILDDIRRIAMERDSPIVTRLQYDEYGEFGATTVVRRFGSWNAAIEAAGLNFACRQNISNEELFENLAAVWTRIGRQPFGRQMSDSTTESKFATATYEKRFGSWNKALLAFADYITRDEGDEQGNVNEQLLAPEKARNSKRRTSRNINWRMRAKILIRDACICKICGDSPAKNPDTVLHVDHIMPWSKGGETVEENLQTLCAVCNIGKSDLVTPIIA